MAMTVPACCCEPLMHLYAFCSESFDDLDARLGEAGGVAVQLVVFCRIPATLGSSQRESDASVLMVSMVVAWRLASFSSTIFVLLRSNASVISEGLRFGVVGEAAGDWTCGVAGACGVVGGWMIVFVPGALTGRDEPAVWSRVSNCELVGVVWGWHPVR